MAACITWCGFKFAATQLYGLVTHPHFYLTDPFGFQEFQHCPSALRHHDDLGSLLVASSYVSLL